MTKKELVGIIAKSAGDLPKSTAEAMLTALADAVAGEMAAGGEISLPGIGKLKSVAQDARTARNPRTGETVQVPAKRKVKFKPAKDLKAAAESAL